MVVCMAARAIQLDPASQSIIPDGVAKDKSESQDSSTEGAEALDNVHSPHQEVCCSKHKVEQEANPKLQGVDNAVRVFQAVCHVLPFLEDSNDTVLHLLEAEPCVIVPEEHQRDRSQQSNNGRFQISNRPILHFAISGQPDTACLKNRNKQ